MRKLTFLIPLLIVTGCDPCAGIGTCGGPYVRVEGEVLKNYPKAPAEGIRVEFVRKSGAILEEDILVAVSDREGRFQLLGTVEGEGDVIGELTFHPPEPIPAVRVAGVRLIPTRAAGQLRFGGTWSIPYPHLPYEAHFFALANRASILGMEVEFRRTGGIRVEPDTFRVTTDFAGNIKLRPLTNEIGELRGELVVYPIPPYRPFVVPNLRMSTFSQERFDSTLVNVGIGRNLPYAGTLVWQDTGDAVKGFELEFRRTGGVPFQPQAFVSTSDNFGTFWVDPVPLASGFVEGQLVVRSPGQYAGYVLRDLRLAVHETEVPVQHMGFFQLPRVVPEKK